MLEAEIRAADPARHPNAVVLCCDDAYLPYAAHVAARVDEMHPDRRFDVCLAGPGLCAPPALVERHRLRRVDVAIGATAGLRLDRKVSAAGYLRLSLPALLGDDYARILYLDGDVEPRGDLSAAFGIDLLGFPLGAVQDVWRWRHAPSRRHPDYVTTGQPALPYLNSGVQLQDTAAWRDGAVDARLRGFLAGLSAPPRLHDQTVLNGTLAGHWAELPPLWNWQTHQTTIALAETVEPLILHYTGGKPWRDPRGRVSDPAPARALARFVAEHFPDAPPPPARPTRRPVAERLRMTTRALLHRGAIERFLARFPDPATARPALGEGA